jgi:hypothetical protein
LHVTASNSVSRLWVYAIHCVALGRTPIAVNSASAVAVFAVSYGLNRFSWLVAPLSLYSHDHMSNGFDCLGCDPTPSVSASTTPWIAHDQLPRFSLPVRAAGATPRGLRCCSVAV